MREPGAHPCVGCKNGDDAGYDCADTCNDLIRWERKQDKLMEEEGR